MADQSDELSLVGVGEQAVKLRSQSRFLVLERPSLDPREAVVIQFPKLGEQRVLGRFDSYGFHAGKDSQMNGTDKRYAVSGMSPIALYLYIVACRAECVARGGPGGQGGYGRQDGGRTKEKGSPSLVFGRPDRV